MRAVVKHILYLDDEKTKSITTEGEYTSIKSIYEGEDSVFLENTSGITHLHPKETIKSMTIYNDKV